MPILIEKVLCIHYAVELRSVQIRYTSTASVRLLQAIFAVPENVRLLTCTVWRITASHADLLFVQILVIL